MGKALEDESGEIFANQSRRRLTNKTAFNLTAQNYKQSHQKPQSRG